MKQYYALNSKVSRGDENSSKRRKRALIIRKGFFRKIRHESDNSRVHFPTNPKRYCPRLWRCAHVRGQHSTNSQARLQVLSQAKLQEINTVGPPRMGRESAPNGSLQSKEPTLFGRSRPESVESADLISNGF